MVIIGPPGARLITPLVELGFGLEMGLELYFDQPIIFLSLFLGLVDSKELE